MAQLITANNIDPAALNTISGPKVTGIQYPGDDTAASIAGGQTVTLTGAGFQTGAVVYVDSVVVGVTSVISSSTISFVTPAKASGNYTLYVVNPDGGTATFLAGIQYSGVPTWSTGSGSLGTVYETDPINYTLSATSDSAVSYTVTSGTLAAGAELNASTGTITGNANLVASSTTYNFTVDAVDQEQQNTSRNFSITVNPDVVTFNSPADNSLYSGQVGDPLIVSLNATSVMGKSITYSANSLPDGLSISGNLISGNYTTAVNLASVITATAADTNKTGNIILNWSVINPPPIVIGQTEYTTAGTYSWTVPADVISVSVVAIGGGGGGARDRSGGGGGGGGLVWVNNISVTPGQTYTVTVGAGGSGNLSGNGSSGGDSWFNNSSYIVATGGGGGSTVLQSESSGGTYINNSGFSGGGGTGGFGGKNTSDWSGGGGGGAGGYTGNGGNGAATYSSIEATAGAGGGGGGGASLASNGIAGAGGGGVSIYGQGANGAAGTYTVSIAYGGGGGSGGTTAANRRILNDGGGTGGSYGAGGGGGTTNQTGSHYNPGNGASGAVRIIWGPDRAFPSTNTGDL